MVIFGNFRCLAHDIMTDQRATEAFLAGIGVATVNQLAVEEKYTTWIHDHRCSWCSCWDRYRDIGKTLGCVGVYCTKQWPGVAAGYHLHATILFITTIQRHPGGHAGARLYA